MLSPLLGLEIFKNIRLSLPRSLPNLMENDNADRV